MNKYILSLILIIGLVLISGINGCPASVDVGGLVLNIKTEAECSKYAESGYMWIANVCCLDSNNNNRCDKDERGAQTLCDDECSVPICGGDTKKVFYDCVKKEDGCKDLEPKGMIIGECGIECFSNSDCKSDERCFHNKCEKEKCGDGSCGLYENCENCPQDCLSENHICCNKNSIGGDCCTSEDCENNNTCVKNQCTPYCGDGICNGDESCGSCPQDCVLGEGEVCCDGVIKEGSCEEPLINETQNNETS